jgi:hypothetical protein
VALRGSWPRAALAERGARGARRARPMAFARQFGPGVVYVPVATSIFFADAFCSVLSPMEISRMPLR